MRPPSWHCSPATALIVAGCGAVARVTEGNPTKGKTLFVAKCGACHILANAKTQRNHRPEPRRRLRPRQGAGVPHVDDHGRRPRADRLPGHEAEHRRPRDAAEPAARTGRARRRGLRRPLRERPQLQDPAGHGRHPALTRARARSARGPGRGSRKPEGRRSRSTTTWATGQS